MGRIIAFVVCAGALAFSGWCLYRGFLAVVAGVRTGGWSGVWEVAVAVLVTVGWGIWLPARVIGIVIEESGYYTTTRRGPMDATTSAAVVIDDGDGDPAD